MIAKELTTDQELEMLSNEMCKFVGTKLAISYLRQGHCFLFLEENSGKLLGGCAIITHAPFRFINLLPKSVLENDNFLKQRSDINFFEVNAFFVKERKSLKAILIEILSYIRDKVNKDYMLIFFNANDRKIANLWQKKLSLTEIYTGKPSSDLIQTSHQLVYFGYTEKKNLIAFLERILNSRQNKSGILIE